MANGGSNGGDAFDVRKVRRLVELMNEHELAEIDLRQGEHRIRLRRGQDPVFASGGSPHVLPGVAEPPTPPPGIEATRTQGAEDVEDSSIYITSPMVGTFYTASSPDTPPFVKIGDQVGPDTVVCILEAMKVFNEIPAECSGKIVAMLIENGDAVEFGQKLFKLE